MCNINESQWYYVILFCVLLMILMCMWLIINLLLVMKANENENIMKANVIYVYVMCMMY